MVCTWANRFMQSTPCLHMRDTAFNDIANQFTWMEKHTRDAKPAYSIMPGMKANKWNGPILLLVVLRISGQGPWAGTPVHWWMHWIIFQPIIRKERAIAILNRLVNALEKQQDKTTGLWKDVLAYNGPGKEKNYFEASASSQFVYAIAKGEKRIFACC